MPGALRRLLRDPDPRRFAGFRAAGEAHLVRLTDRYLDTHEVHGRLAAELLRARVRRRGREITLTVKRAGVEADGVTTRPELEGPATSSLDPTGWPESDAKAALLAATGHARLVEIARLRQRRLTRVFERAGTRVGTRVEVSLDTLEALDRDRVVERRHDLEAELLDGEPAALAELVAALRRLPGVGPPLGSKLAFAREARAASRVAGGPKR